MALCCTGIMVYTANGAKETTVYGCISTISVVLSFAIASQASEEHLFRMWASLDSDTILLLSLPPLLLATANSVDRFDPKQFLLHILLISSLGSITTGFLMTFTTRILLPYEWSIGFCLLFAVVILPTEMPVDIIDQAPICVKMLHGNATAVTLMFATVLFTMQNDILLADLPNVAPSVVSLAASNSFHVKGIFWPWSWELYRNTVEQTGFSGHEEERGLFLNQDRSWGGNVECYVGFSTLCSYKELLWLRHSGSAVV